MAIVGAMGTAMLTPWAGASGIVRRVDERDDAELAELAALLRERNALDGTVTSVSVGDLGGSVG
jgi:hypothetical protein